MIGAGIQTSAPRMLIVTRFGIGVRDLAWYEHRLALLSGITQPSLLAQTDQAFDWVLVTDPSLPDSLRRRLRKIVEPFAERAHLCPHSRYVPTLREIATRRRMVDGVGNLLVGRIDDDDAWVRHTVEEVRARVACWRRGGPDTSGYGLSFATGLAWQMYDMVDLDRLEIGRDKIVLKAAIRGYSHPFTSISGYTYAKAPEALAAVVTGHARVEALMRENGYTVDVVWGDSMWLYCRHKQTDSPVVRGEGPKLDLSVADLEASFGIDPVLVKRYIAAQNRYGYVRSLRMQGLRAEVLRELKAINVTLASENGGAREDDQLLNRRATLLARLEDLSANAISSPTEDPGEMIGG